MNLNRISITHVLYFATLLPFSSGCGDEEKPAEQTKPACPLKIDSLDGTEWVYLDSSQKPEVPSPKARFKFYKENNNIMVKYNSLSLAEMYDYQCKIDAAKNQIQCNSTPDPKEVCKAYLASDKKCTNNAMAKFYDKFDEKELKKAINEAKKEQGLAYKQKKLEQFNKLFNRLDNKLMGRMNIDINAEDCNLTVYDYYSTINNGEIIENGNAVGTNAFVSASNLPNKPKLLWEHCDSTNLFDTQSAEFPTKPETVRGMGAHSSGTEIHYWLLEDKTRKIEEGCSYSYDLYLNAILKETGKTPEVSKDGKETRFYFSQTFEKATTTGMPEVFVMDITKTCGEKKEKIVACNKVYIR